MQEELPCNPVTANSTHPYERSKTCQPHLYEAGSEQALSNLTITWSGPRAGVTLQNSGYLSWELRLTAHLHLREELGVSNFPIGARHPLQRLNLETARPVLHRSPRYGFLTACLWERRVTELSHAGVRAMFREATLAVCLE